MAVAEVTGGVAAAAEDGRAQVPPGHEPGPQHQPGQGGRAVVLAAADRVQPGQLGRVADGVAEAAQVPDLVGREAAAQDRGLAVDRPWPEGAEADIAQPDLGRGRRVVEGQRGHAHLVPPAAHVPVDPGPQPQARGRRRGGVGQLVGLAGVARLQDADPGRQGAALGRAGAVVALAEQDPAAVAGEPDPDRQAVVLGLDRPGRAERLVEPVKEGLDPADGRVQAGQGGRRDRDGLGPGRGSQAVDHCHDRAGDHGRGQGAGDQDEGCRAAPPWTQRGPGRLRVAGRRRRHAHPHPEGRRAIRDLARGRPQPRHDPPRPRRPAQVAGIVIRGVGTAHRETCVVPPGHRERPPTRGLMARPDRRGRSGGPGWGPAGGGGPPGPGAPAPWARSQTGHGR